MYYGNMSIFTYIKKHSVVSVVFGLGVVVIAIIGGRIASRNSVPVMSSYGAKGVVLAEVRDFRSDASVVSADGVVESVSQADLKSQISAPVAMTYVSIGDMVNKGQAIAELQNADIRAQLDQARATLALAKGQYDTGTISVDSARQSALDRIRDTYLKADDAVNIQIGQFLFNRDSGSVQLVSLITDSKIYNNISTQWTDVGNIFYSWKVNIDSLTNTSADAEIDAALALAQKNAAAVNRFLDLVSTALVSITNSSSVETLPIIAGWKQTVGTIRTSMSAATISLTSAQSAFANARSSHTSPGQAQISSAEAGVKNLEAQLAKTIITAPLSGTIAALPLRAGELASPGQLIATVVGSGGLQVRAYVSGEDLARIQKDAEVTIRGSIKGRVISIAPSVSQANKKAEIKIAITDPKTANLVVGESVQALIKADSMASIAETAATSGTYILPIQDVKIVPGDAYVFTIDSESKVKKVPVILGEVKGDFIEVKSGLDDSMSIISPVYELNEGDVVRVQ